MPKDVLIEIFARVSSQTVSDIYNVQLTYISNIKLSCKEFLRVTEHDYVYHNSSLDKFALEPLEWINTEKPFRHYVELLCPNEEGSLNVRKVFKWKLSPEQRFNKERHAYFLRRCKESSNPEIMYCEGMFEYFRETSSSNSIALAFENLKTAALNGHDDAINHVKSMIRSMWVHREVVAKHNLSFFHSSRCKLLKVLIQQSLWILDEDIDDYGIEWENCKADVELKVFCRMIMV
ncbi:uncharacterized protein LOC133312176 [Gastrolobium bilobum]|uniref:uncharacterized protein LOC133312176 n=1 Tax=Gastrolobium bilobum TaxID=150636 RepID=UPI002AB0D87C|nr:uncharacterized protein LOC133312176 [Gastrolobium bilobum]